MNVNVSESAAQFNTQNTTDPLEAFPAECLK